MKKTLSVLLAVLLLVACIPATIFGSVSAETDSIWSKRVALSEGATLSEADCSLTAGSEATFKVTLPAGGYAQFQQKLGDFFGDAAFFNTNYVKIVVGNGKKATYNMSNLYVQLTSSADASKDIVPVDEPAGIDPGTDGMTWHLYGCNKEDGNYAYGLNKGSSTYDGAQFTHVANIETHHLMVSFTKETSGNVTVNQRYGATNANDYANRKMPSTKTLAEIDGEDGVYVRIRNGEDKEQTYTVTVYSSDVSAGYRDGEFILSDTESSVNSVDYALSNGNLTIEYDVTLANDGSFVQFDKKISDLIGGGAKVNIFPYKTNESDEIVNDYVNAYFYVQLVGKDDLLKDVAPVQETKDNTLDPGTDAMTWRFYSATNRYALGKGSNVGAGFGSTVGYFSAFANNGVTMFFTKTTAGKVYINAGDYRGSETCQYVSYHTVDETNMSDGAYFRLRHNNTAQKYKITITTKATPYTDGAWKLSDGGSKVISSSRVVNADNKIEETAIVMLSGNGGYVQLDRLIKDFATGASLKVKVSDGSADAYKATQFQVQLTGDKAALTDVPGVDEYNGGQDPGKNAMTWLLYPSTTFYALGKGTSTAGIGTTASYYSNITSGMPFTFLKTEDNKVNIKTQNFNGADSRYASKYTISDIGLDNGAYVRVRNRSGASNTFTITITYNNVFANTVENGTVTLDKAAALKGETVKATVVPAANYQLKAGSLKYTVDGSKYYPITARVDDSADVFAFAMPEDAVNVTAEFVSVDAPNNALLGAAYNIEDGAAGKDMRFGSRAYRSAGKKGDLISCGNYLLLANGALGTSLGLQDGVELTEQQITDLLAGDPTRVPTSVLNDRCDDYVDYTVRIVGVADGYENVDYVCISYANYRDAEGNVTTTYSAPCIRSYNQLISAAQ